MTLDAYGAGLFDYSDCNRVCLISQTETRLLRQSLSRRLCLNNCICPKYGCRSLLLLRLGIEKVVDHRDDRLPAGHQRDVCCIGQNG